MFHPQEGSESELSDRSKKFQKFQETEPQPQVQKHQETEAQPQAQQPQETDGPSSPVSEESVNPDLDIDEQIGDLLYQSFINLTHSSGKLMLRPGEPFVSIRPAKTVAVEVEEAMSHELELLKAASNRYEDC